jgi:O-antigen/teichoic acid export membrane protein
MRGVRVRLAASVVSNLLRVAIAFVTGLLTARMLGPGDYGNYTFLLSSFAAFASLTDMGMGSAFYTLMSRTRRGLRFVVYYGGWLAMQLGVLTVFVLLAPNSVFKTIWLGQARGLVLLALVASFAMTQVWAFTGQIGESVRETVGVQLRNLLSAFLYLIVVVAVWATHHAHISVLLWATAVIYLVLAAAHFFTLYRKAHFPANTIVNVREMLRSYKEYFFPSVVVMGALFTFLDPWLLQRFAGSVQQGYYSVAIRLSSVALLMTSAVIQVMWKEIAEAFDVRNMIRVRQMEFMCARGLCFVAAALAGALMPFAKEILAATLGSAYAAARLPFALLLIYPMYQAMHTVYDTSLLAIGQAKIRSRIVVSFFAVSIVISYVLVAPRSALIPGLQLGAGGLALKMVVSQAVQANVASYFAAKHSGSTYDWKHQLVLLSVLIPIGFAYKLLVESLAGLMPSLPPLIVPVVSLLGYLATAAALVFRYPLLAGLSTAQRQAAIASIKARLRRPDGTVASC